MSTRTAAIGMPRNSTMKGQNINTEHYDIAGASALGLLRHVWPLLLVCLMAACATPGSADYTAAAADLARQAQLHNQLARQHEAAMRVLQTEGDTEGAEISRRAMEEERRSARWDRFNAEKDFWLSQF
jgi:hypothetical protein